jgi:hypothetical protein
VRDALLLDPFFRFSDTVCQGGMQSMKSRERVIRTLEGTSTGVASNIKLEELSANNLE